MEGTLISNHLTQHFCSIVKGGVQTRVGGLGYLSLQQWAWKHGKGQDTLKELLEKEEQ